MPWMTIALIALGGAIGSNARFWLASWVTRLTGITFPWGTFAVNITGSLIAGIIVACLDRFMARPEWRLFVVTGVLGGYTTFSAYELETFGLWSQRRYAEAFGYLFGSAALGFLAVMAGFTASEAFLIRLKGSRM